MILGSQAYISSIDLADIPKIELDGIPLPYITNACNLGVWITPTLECSRHVSCVVSRVYRARYALKFFRHALSKDLKRRLVETLIFFSFE